MAVVVTLAMVMVTVMEMGMVGTGQDLYQDHVGMAAAVGMAKLEMVVGTAKVGKVVENCKGGRGGGGYRRK